MAEMSPLRRRMIEDMTIRNLSPATQRSYLHAVLQSRSSASISAERLGLEDVRAYRVHLASKGVAWDRSIRSFARALLLRRDPWPGDDP